MGGYIKASAARDNSIHEKTHQITHRQKKKKFLAVNQKFSRHFSRRWFFIEVYNGEGNEREENGDGKIQTQEEKSGEGQKHFYLLSEKKGMMKQNLLLAFNKHRSRFIIGDCPIIKKDEDMEMKRKFFVTWFCWR